MNKQHQTLCMLLLTICLFTACRQKTAGQDTTGQKKADMAIAQLEWLIGSWHNSSAEGDASEIWKKQSDSVYAGQSFFVAGKDTVSSEKLRIEQRGNDLFYIPTVSNQNGGKPVEFKLTGKKGEQWIFENPGHDFPTKISYTRIGADSVLAEISGLMDGKPSSQQFPMKKSD